MAKNNENDLYGTSFSAESIKVIAESIGIGCLPDDAAKELADDISFRTKHIIQDAAKFMHHAKRTKLMNVDIDNALKLKNLEVRIHIYSLVTQLAEWKVFSAAIWISFCRDATVSLRFRWW